MFHALEDPLDGARGDSVGPVLSRADAVANKIGALYSRAEARDFLDVDDVALAQMQARLLGWSRRLLASHD